jgi:hypothetical protein
LRAGKFPHDIDKINVGSTVEAENRFPPLLLFKGNSVADFPYQTGKELFPMVKVFPGLLNPPLENSWKDIRPAGSIQAKSDTLARSIRANILTSGGACRGKVQNVGGKIV